MVMNGVLLFLVVKKPTQRQRPPREFISNQLDFNDGQTDRFMELDREHHRKMRRIDDELHELKNMLFYDVNNGISRRSWARNEEAIFAIKREMKRTSKLKVTIPNKLNTNILDKIF